MEKCVDIQELYKRDPKLKEEDVKMVIDWCKKQAHLPEVLELQAALAVHSCYYSVEAAKNCLDRCLTIRTACPNIFGNTNPETNRILKENMDLMTIIPLPGVTPKGITPLLMKLHNPDPSLWDTTTAESVIDMMLLHQQFTKGPTNGVCFVWDLKGATLTHLAKTNISNLRKFTVYADSGALIRIIHIHCINPVPFMDKVLGIIRPLVSKEFYKRILVHMDIEELYECVPKELLPIEYGGKCESSVSLHEKFKKIIYEAQPLFDFTHTQMVDESKRSESTNKASNIFGFDGTFKQIDID